MPRVAWIAVVGCAASEDIPDFDAEEDIGEVSLQGTRTGRVENLTTGGYWDLVKQDGEWRLDPSD
jgi:hypothetical protein